VVSRCANPGCGAPFLYFREGRLFAAPHKSPAAGIEYFWLCAHCAHDLELKFSESGSQPMVVPRRSYQKLPPLEIPDFVPLHHRRIRPARSGFKASH
jgi:hypothetical protein